MKKFTAFVYLCACLSVASCSTGGDDSCTSGADCIDGYACIQGTCQKRDTLVIETSSLIEGAVDLEYRLTLEANGGEKPYHWFLDSGPDWMSLDENSGSLQGTPDKAQANIEVKVRVTDESAPPGQSATATLMLSVVECVDSSAQACFESQGGKCFQGSRLCASGQWSECSELTHASRMEHCGPDCGQCDLLVSDGCYLGSCTCGDGPACAGGQACCLQKCVDLADDDTNCGECGLNCTDQVNAAQKPHCENGKCDYDVCQENTLDCDDDRSNGCETTRGMDNCSFCNQPCVGMVQRATGIKCAQDETSGEFACDYEQCELGFYDCDGDRSNGCEIEASSEHCGTCDTNCGANPDGISCVLDKTIVQYRCGCTVDSSCDGGQRQCCDLRCVDRDDVNHCGDCETSCNDPSQPACIDPYNGNCGCDSNDQCGAGFICCDEHCIAIDVDNCGECGRVCDAKTDHGSRCDLETGTCYCEGSEDCQLSGFAMSGMTCRSSVCVCEWSNDPTNPVDPTYPDENIPCCGVVWVSDIMSNPVACGQCGVQCQPGEDCVNGGCTCSSDSDCPKYSSATACDQNLGRCMCSDNPDGDFPCQDGRSCCNGDFGGAGGPDGEADLGCCWYQCGDNAPGDCLY